MSTDETGPVADQTPPADQADYERSGGLPRRPRSLRDPAGPVAAPMAYGTLAVLVLALIWAGLRYSDLEGATRELAATQANAAVDVSADGTTGGGGGGDGGGGGGGNPEPTDFPTEEPSDPGPAPEPAKTGIVGVPGQALFFDPDEMTIELGVPVVVRNTSQRRCTMTATEDSEVVPAMLEGENDPVLESADDVTANHTVTFLSPQEPGTATLRCDSEETIDPTEIPTEEGTPSGDETEPTSDGATPAESGDEEGSDDEPTTEVVPSEELTVSWLG